MESNVVKQLQDTLCRATETRRKQRLKVDAGLMDESHYQYSDGFVDGLEMAIATLIAADKSKEMAQG